MVDGERANLQSRWLPSRAALLDPGFWADRTVVIAFVGLLIAGWFLSPSFFFTGGNFNGIMRAAAILTILTVGQTFVVLTGGIDLSVAAVTMLSSVTLGFVAITHGLGVPIGIVLALAVGALCGTISGIVIAKGGVADFIATLGMLSFAQGAGLYVSHAETVFVNDPEFSKLATGGVSLGLIEIPYIFIVSIGVVIVGHVLLFRTRFGTHLLAIGGSKEASRALGIPVDRIKISAYAISGLMAGLAGVMLTAYLLSAAPTPSSDNLLNSVAATVIGGVSLVGGRGTILGPALGAVFLIALTNLLTLLGINQYVQYMVIGGVVVGSALLYRYQRV
jgi:ribose/xylose/arabinose/galactoside ABC-type transport system permease subunit